ncbi:MAG: 16S rRNA (cytosine(1402)-N(4))-methyltransferase RsmH [Pseudomonadota bacterium]
MTHIPVMLEEVLVALAPAANDVIVDGTFGGGGYTLAILAAADCEVFGIDRDLDAIARAEAMAETEPRLHPLFGRFGDLDAVLQTAGLAKVDGIVLDIGVSSFQLDEDARGFSFMRDGPLDMRMGQTGPSAADVVNSWSEGDLTQLIRALGEDRQAKRIARAIVRRRDEAAFETTLDLASVVEDAVGGRRGQRTHPATKTFQALRMLVNDELGELARALSAAEARLKPGGRLVVVCFHSLEDRIVKTFVRTHAGETSGGSRHRPVTEAGPAPSFAMQHRKAIEPSEEEIAANPRARSAKLRVAVRTEAPAWNQAAETGVSLPELEGSVSPL